MLSLSTVLCFFIGFVVINYVSSQPVLIKTDVVIGGAGYSGIAAGKTLSQHDDVSFVIVEASDRMGGRMYNVPIGENSDTGEPYVVELGANWIDGLEGNPMWDVAKEVNLGGYYDDSSSTRYYDEDGKFRRDETDYEDGSNCYKASEASDGASDMGYYCLRLSEGDKVDKDYQDLCNLIRPNFEPRNDDDYSVQDLMNKYNGFYPPNEKEPSMARACEVSMNLEGQDTSTMSGIYREDPSYTEFEGRDWWVADTRGFAWLVKTEAADYLSTSVNTNSRKVFNDDRMKFNTKVVEVRWNLGGTKRVQIVVCETIKTIAPNSPILYPCKTGADANLYIIEANEFISTFSRDVLKKSVELEDSKIPISESHDVAPRFVPSLSTTLPSIATTAMREGDLAIWTKVFVQFPKRFWTNSDYFVSAYSRDTWIGNFATVWQSLDTKGDAHTSSNILLLYQNGERAVDVSSKTDDEIINDVLAVLNKTFKNRIMEEFGRSELMQSDVIDIQIGRWERDPLFYGGFSASRFGYTDAMQASLSKRYGNLVLSGEHSCLRFDGYTHGAKFSGERSARQLMYERYDKDVDPNSICENGPYTPPEPSCMSDFEKGCANGLDCCSGVCDSGRFSFSQCKPESAKRSRLKRLCNNNRGGSRYKKDC